MDAAHGQQAVLLNARKKGRCSFRLLDASAGGSIVGTNTRAHVCMRVTAGPWRAGGRLTGAPGPSHASNRMLSSSSRKLSCIVMHCTRLQRAPTPLAGVACPRWQTQPPSAGPPPPAAHDNHPYTSGGCSSQAADTVERPCVVRLVITPRGSVVWLANSSVPRGARAFKHTATRHRQQDPHSLHGGASKGGAANSGRGCEAVRGYGVHLSPPPGAAA